VLRKHTDVPNRDLSGLLQLSGDYAVHELAIKAGERSGRRDRDLRG
jgi:hypothetical protein